MIFNYSIEDGWGDHFWCLIQAPTREEADLEAQNQIDNINDIKRKRFELKWASVTDKTNKKVLGTDFYDHEIGT